MQAVYLFIVQLYSSQYIHTSSNLYTCALVLMDPDTFTMDEKCFERTAATYIRLKRHGILANVAPKLLTLVI